MFQTGLPCFWYFEKVPDAATLHDGGEWLCGLQQLHETRSSAGKDYGKSCIVYSMGSRNVFDFERRIRTLAPGCEIHTFDPTVPGEVEKGKKWYDAMHLDYSFGGVDSNAGKFPVKSLATIMKELGHDHVDVLKVDVEGYEWSFFEEVDWSTAQVGQLLVEVHMKSDMTVSYMNGVFTKLEQAGFYLISAEYVTKRNWGQAELVFMHKTWRPNGFVDN